MKFLSSFIHDHKKIRLLQLVVIILAPILMYIFNNSAPAFILFLASLLILFKTELNMYYKISIILVDLLVVMPLVGVSNSYYLDVITQVGIYAILAIGLNIVVGFTGLLNLGYVGFYAAGAYIYAVFASSQANNFIPEAAAKFPISGNWFWLFLIISMVGAAGIGLLIGLPVLRLRGDYLAVVTLGFGEIIRILLNNLDKPINFTNGPKGITPIQPPELFGMVLDKPIHYYFIVLVLLLFTIIIVNRLKESRIGRAWIAIKEDEVAARTMGIPVVKMKLLAFAFGASFAGMMGVVFAAKQTFVDPMSFGFMESIGILAMVIMGGLGSIAGAVVGAMAVIVLQLQILKDFSNFLRELSVSGAVQIPSQLDPAKYEKLVFGLILIIMCIYRPQGFLPVKRSLKSLNHHIKKITARNKDTNTIYK